MSGRNLLWIKAFNTDKTLLTISFHRISQIFIQQYIVIILSNNVGEKRLKNVRDKLARLQYTSCYYYHYYYYWLFSAVKYWARYITIEIMSSSVVCRHNFLSIWYKHLTCYSQLLSHVISWQFNFRSACGVSMSDLRFTLSADKSMYPYFTD